MNSDNYIEKSFIYLLVVSLLLHLGALALLVYLPKPKQQFAKEPVFIDLQDVQLPKLQQPPPTQAQPVKPRPSDRRVRVARETAPRANDMVDRGRRRAPRATSAPSRPTAPQARPTQPTRETTVARRTRPIADGTPASSLLKPRSPAAAQTPRAKLFPGAAKMARMEEDYRRKYEKDIAEGDVKFLNTDDILFGSFMTRFKTAVYNVWRYPREAAQKGIEGITPVMITFNRQGEVTKIQLLESSGSKILDDEVFRSLRMIGPVGGFPKGYNKDEFKLIGFFHYGTRRMLY